VGKIFTDKALRDQGPSPAKGKLTGSRQGSDPSGQEF